MRLGHSKSLRERFEGKYQRAEGCWLWHGARGGDGYGILAIGGRKNPVEIMAHRVAWTLFRGDIPKGLHVLHRCDNPPCVNPDHLFLGTQQDNNKDRDDKGRTAKGEQRPEAKLTAAQVRGIRTDPRRNCEIARELDLDPSTISHIKARRIWRHVQ